jgi:hypothetical protein
MCSVNYTLVLAKNYVVRKEQVLLRKEYLPILELTVGRNSVDNIVIRYGLDGPGIESR